MSFSLIYLVNRFFYRIYVFVEHWYVGGFRYFARNTIYFLERLDRYFALKVTLRYWLRPLYQDYSVIGYTLGFVFRTGRILSGGFLYLLVILAGVSLYIFWAAFPVYLIIKGFTNL